jgi:hypothetical protein
MNGTLKKTALALVLGVLLVTTGCIQGGDTEPQDIRDSSVEAMESVDTYAFNTETDLEAKAEEGDTQDKLSITAFVRGTASESVGTMRTSSNFVINEESIDQETYSRTPNSSTEGMATYVRLRNDGEEGRWYNMGEIATSSTPVESHVLLLKGSEVEYEGEKEIQNESAHVLSLDTGTEQYKEFSVGKAQNLMFRSGIGVNEQLLDEAEIGNASLRYWVSDETDRILKVESTANVSTTVPGAEDELEITVDSETTFSSYNGEVNTDTPEGIENAGEFENMFSGSGSTSQGTSEGGEAGAAAYASESGPIDVMEVRFRESGGTRTSTATITTEPISADKITAEALESGDTASAQNLNASREELKLELDPDGDEVVVTVERGNETEVVYNQTVRTAE